MGSMDLTGYIEMLAIVGKWVPVARTREEFYREGAKTAKKSEEIFGDRYSNATATRCKETDFNCNSSRLGGSYLFAATRADSPPWKLSARAAKL
jgi:hypothetical protein